MLDVVSEKKIAEYVKAQKALKFKPNEKVKIMFQAEHGTQGWDNCWTKGMTRHIGKIGRVIRRGGIDQIGVPVYFEEANDVEGSWWYFPYFVLKRIK